MVLQALVSQHLGTLRTQEESHTLQSDKMKSAHVDERKRVALEHAMQSDKMKSAHEDERKRVALEHVAARRSEDAQLRDHMQEEYDCKLVIEHRKWFTAVQGDPLHAVHQVPKYDDLTVGGQAQEKC